MVEMSTHVLRSGTKRQLKDSSCDSQVPDHQPSTKRIKSTKTSSTSRKSHATTEKKLDPNTKPLSGPDNEPVDSNVETLNSPSSKLQILESQGDLFAPRTLSSNTPLLLIHACNCEGIWGAGIAKTFAANFTTAYESYSQHCASASSMDKLLDSALLIPPPHSSSTFPSSSSARFPQTSKSPKPSTGTIDKRLREEQVFVGCLFTSRFKGRKKEPQTRILEATRRAMRDLMQQVRKWNEESDNKIQDVRMCRINAGLFGVPWERTKAVLEGLTAEGFGTIDVISLPE